MNGFNGEFVLVRWDRCVAVLRGRFERGKRIFAPLALLSQGGE